MSVLFLILALIGFADATFLTVEHYLGSIPPCGPASGCSTVLTSSWSEIGGVPVALLGAFYYLAILLLTIVYLRFQGKKSEGGEQNTNAARALKIAAWSTILGLISSAFFVSLQLFVLKSICLYCMVSAASSTALFVVGMLILWKGCKREKQQTV